VTRRAKPPKHEARRRAQLQGPKPLPTHAAPTAVSLREAAGYLGIHTSTLRRWIGSGKLKAEGLQIEMAEIARLRELMDAEQR
jgi:hypothetical protein